MSTEPIKPIKPIKYDDKVEVRPSTLPGAGYGLFARRNFSKKSRERLAQYTGRVVRRQDHPDGQLPGGPYVLQVTNDIIIDSVDPETPGLARWANMCRTQDVLAKRAHGNNAKLCVHPRNPLDAFIRPIKNIKAGEEIFVSYGRTYRWF